MNEFCGGRCAKSFLDVEVFDLHAPTNHSSTPRSHHENTKKLTYEA